MEKTEKVRRIVLAGLLAAKAVLLDPGHYPEDRAGIQVRDSFSG